MEEFDYSPMATHQLFLEAEHEIPQFEPDELIARINAFCEAGYLEIGGVLVGSWQTSVRSALSLHELAANHLRRGALIGPYTFSYGIAVAGIKLYLPSKL